MDKCRIENSGGEDEESGRRLTFSGMHVKERENSLEFEFNRNNSLSLNSDPNHSFPAELLFNNGQLVPHAFPFHTGSRKTSCTSSKNSSRSPRSSYSSSSSSSSRVSRQNSMKKWPESETIAGKTVHIKSPAVKKPAVGQPYSAPPRLQFLTPAPTRNYSGKSVSSKKKAEVSLTESGISKEMKVNGNRKPAGSWFGRRFLWSFVSACRECHALEPVVREGDLPGRNSIGLIDGTAIVGSSEYKVHCF